MSEPVYNVAKVAARLGFSTPDLAFVLAEVVEREGGAHTQGDNAELTLGRLEGVLAHLRNSMSNPPPDNLDFREDLLPAAASVATTGSDGDDSGKEKSQAVHAPWHPTAPHPVQGLTVLIHHRNYPNPRLLIGRTPEGELVTVGVMNNKNFRPNMKLNARLVRPGRYEMEGRCPRFPGRY